MNTVVRLFLEESAEQQVRAALAELKVTTVGKKYPITDSNVVNVFDPRSLNELIMREFPKREQAILVAHRKHRLGTYRRIYRNLETRGVGFLGVVKPSSCNWKSLFGHLIG